MSAPDFPHRSWSRSPNAIVLKACQDQTLFPRFVKGLAAQCSHDVLLACDVLPFLTGGFENGRGHGLFACEIATSVACLAHILVFTRKKMTRGFAFLFATLMVLGGVGQAQS